MRQKSKSSKPIERKTTKQKPSSIKVLTKPYLRSSRNIKRDMGGSPTKIQRCWHNQEDSSPIFARWVWIIANEGLRIYFWLSHKNYGDSQSNEKKWRSPHRCSDYWENFEIPRSKIWFCCCRYWRVQRSGQFDGGWTYEFFASSWAKDCQKKWR